MNLFYVMQVNFLFYEFWMKWYDDRFFPIIFFKYWLFVKSSNMEGKSSFD